MAEALRVLVLNTAASKTGALSVLRDFHSFVAKESGGALWFFIVGAEGLIEESDIYPHIRVIKRPDIKRSRLSRLAFDHFTGSTFLNSLKPDVVFSMQNTLPAGAERLKDSKGRPVRKVIYLHQPLGFQKYRKFSFFNRYERELAVYQQLIAPEIDRSLKRADRIIVQTEWMRDAVCEKDGIPPERISIVTPDIGDPGGLCKPFENRDTSLFFYPAGSILYKDHQCILDAAGILREKGEKDFRVVFTEKRDSLPWIRIPEGVEENVEFRGMMARDEVMSLYRRSVLVFPSYIETFGYPLAEAAGLNTPVIASDTPFAREILEKTDRKRFFRVSSAEELAELMEDSIKNGWGEEKGISAENREKGENPGASWSRVTDILIRGV